MGAGRRRVCGGIASERKQVHSMQMQKVNYQKKTEELIIKEQREGRVPTLLLHSCCAPCSSYVLEYLSDYFSVTVLYYNPNISPEKEYMARVEEQRRLIAELPTKHPVSFLAGEYVPEQFYKAVKGLEQCPEGGDRCTVCYEMRLREAAEVAKRGGFDYFTTTLSISPLKDAVRLNSIGEALAEEYGLSYLYSDFKKKNGYKRSTELSAQYGLYRQDYCGCVFSKEEQRLRKEAAEQGTNLQQ